MTIDQLIGVLAERRRELNLTQRELALRMGVVQSALSGWEHHTGEPSMRKLWLWAGVLGVEIVARPNRTEQGNEDVRT